MQAVPSNVQALVDALIQREGGYSNDPNDRGGPTKYGITLATLHAWRGTPVSASDVEALTTAEASEIYASDFYFKPGFNAVTEPALQEFMFDFAVQSGPGTAVESLQRVIGAHVDGDLGPQSLKALGAVTNQLALFFAVKCERFEFLLRDIGAHPSDAGFAVGWSNRLDTMSEKLS